jgi:hypothetical protein
MNFLVQDRGQDIGAILLKNDTVNLAVRDDYIGWSLRDDDQTIDKERLKFTARVTCVSPHPTLIPLIASLSYSKIVLDSWNKKYPNQHLVGLTTTSLTSDLKHWDYCGDNIVNVDLEPSKIVQEQIEKWMKSKYPTRDLKDAYDILGVKPTIEYIRKVYFCSLYKDTIAFLRKDMEEIKAEPAWEDK